MATVTKCEPKVVNSTPDLIDVFRNSLNTEDIFSKDGWDIGCKLIAPLIVYLETAMKKSGVKGTVASVTIPWALEATLSEISKESGGVVTINPSMDSQPALNCQVLIWKAIKADVIKSLASRKGSSASDIIDYYRISDSIMNDTSMVSLIIANLIAYLCFSVNIALPLPGNFPSFSSAILDIDKVATKILKPTTVGFPLFANYSLSISEVEAITAIFQLLIPQQKGVPPNNVVVSLTVSQPGGKQPVNIKLQNHQLNGPLGLRTAQAYIDPLVADVVYSNCKDGIFNGLPSKSETDIIGERYCSPSDDENCNKTCSITPGHSKDDSGKDGKGGKNPSPLPNHHNGKGSDTGSSPLPNYHKKKGMAGWEIALIIVGSTLIIGGIITAVVLSVKHHKKLKQVYNKAAPSKNKS